MEGGPLVTAMMPTSNSMPYIQLSVESVLEQTYPNVELVAVDNCSDDGTVDYLRGIEEGNDNVIVHVEESGLSEARNKMAELASGDYYGFIDSDDIWLPQKTETQLAAFEDGVDWTFTGRVVRNRAGVDVKLDRPTTEDVASVDWYSSNPISAPSSVMVTADRFHEIGGFDESFPSVEDYELYFRLRDGINFKAIPDPLVVYRLHASQMSRDRKLIERGRERLRGKHGVDI